jgi:hypothetical protein
MYSWDTVFCLSARDVFLGHSLLCFCKRNVLLGHCLLRICKGMYSWGTVFCVSAKGMYSWGTVFCVSAMGWTKPTMENIGKGKQTVYCRPNMRMHLLRVFSKAVDHDWLQSGSRILLDQSGSNQIIIKSKLKVVFTYWPTISTFKI